MNPPVQPGFARLLRSLHWSSVWIVQFGVCKQVWHCFTSCVIIARPVTLTSLATSLQNVYVKPVISHSSTTPGHYATNLLCLTCSWLETTYFWASNLGLLPLQSEVVLLSWYSMGNVCTWPSMSFPITLNLQNSVCVSVVLAKFHWILRPISGPTLRLYQHWQQLLQ